MTIMTVTPIMIIKITTVITNQKLKLKTKGPQGPFFI
jgi:hypothetical protein